VTSSKGQPAAVPAPLGGPDPAARTAEGPVAAGDRRAGGEPVTSSSDLPPTDPGIPGRRVLPNDPPAEPMRPMEAVIGVDPLLGITEGLARDRIWTVPNALSVLRLLGVPLFLWLLLGPQADGWAIVVLALAGISDWADGKIARALDQGSRLGTLLDPAADRLYIVAALVALALRDVVPLWLVGLLVAREFVLGVLLLVLRRYGYPALQVHYLGKAATFILLYAFPLLLVAHGEGPVASVVEPIAWALTIWGTVLYLLAGVLYAAQVVRIVGTERALRAGRTAS
jgi:cardiolipin synthase